MSSIGAEKAPESKPVTPGAMCAEMMQQASPEGQKAMHDFMQSERDPQAMASMMEMMGSMGGGMMGGRGGMMQPGGAHPGK